MEHIKLAGILGVVMIMSVACGQGGLTSPLIGPTDTQRGEANAIDPARNITVICEKDRNGNPVSVTVNITNNCNKDNPVTTEQSEPAG